MPSVRVTASAAASTPASGALSQGPKTPKRPATGAHSETLAWNGIEREYTYVIPPGYNHLVPMPLLIILHGEDGAPNIETEGKRALLAGIHRASMITVLPKAYGKPTPGDTAPSWNDGRCGNDVSKGPDDVAFLRALLPALRAKLVVDLKRVYLVGYGSGASMTHLAAAALGDKIAAMVAVGGRVGCKTDALPTPMVPVSAMIVHGTKDLRFPYQGGRGRIAGGKKDPAESLSVDDALAYWKRADGCKQPAWRTKTKDGKSSRESYACAGGTEVVRIAESELRHAWPAQVEDKPAMRIITEFLRGKKRD